MKTLRKLFYSIAAIALGTTGASAEAFETASADPYPLPDNSIGSNTFVRIDVRSLSDQERADLLNELRQKLDVRRFEGVMEQIYATGEFVFHRPPTSPVAE